MLQPDGRIDAVEVALPQIRIGSGAHCEIRLPAHLTAKEYVFLVFGEQEATAEALAFEPAPLLDGTPFNKATIIDRASITIGDVTIEVELLEPQVLNQQTAGKSHGLSPITIFALILAVPISLYLLTYKRTAVPVSVPTTEVALWPAGSATCPSAEPSVAKELANQALLTASAQAEREPFHPEEGVKAVQQYEFAAACLKGMNVPEKHMARVAAARLKQRLNSGFHAHRVKMEHAISKRDWETVQSEMS